MHLEDSPAWRRCAQQSQSLHDLIRARAAAYRGAWEDERLAGIGKAFADLTVAERRSVLSVLRLEDLQRDGTALSDADAQSLVFQTVPGPAQVRPDLALTLPGTGTAVEVLAVIDGKTRSRAGRNMPTALQAFGVTTRARLPAAVLEDPDPDAARVVDGVLRVAQQTAYRYGSWEPSGWRRSADTRYVFLAPNNAYEVPGWLLADLEELAAALLDADLREPRDTLTEALGLHLAEAAVYPFRATTADGQTKRAKQITPTPRRKWGELCWRGELREIWHTGRRSRVRHDLGRGWLLYVDDDVLDEARRTGDGQLLDESNDWSADLRAAGERPGWDDGLGCLTLVEGQPCAVPDCGHIDDRGTTLAHRPRPRP
ncbi:hypothetical protein SAMN05660359_00453 [Geodermatophilus obscurus]|uniref:Uncharacterized protein n=1 Tax=Geodermatophilus obscurus TaxID=1861 RepID=A0A1I5CQV2_9ACTN|nr:hypothetical protein [Geodermatophilus obscurus]SFN89021.1 hypothetical protein SAMN05660359_00453 [Geodermatophilus obscurus]